MMEEHPHSPQHQQNQSPPPPPQVSPPPQPTTTCIATLPPVVVHPPSQQQQLPTTTTTTTTVAVAATVGVEEETIPTMMMKETVLPPPSVSVPTAITTTSTTATATATTTTIDMTESQQLLQNNPSTGSSSNNNNNNNHNHNSSRILPHTIAKTTMTMTTMSTTTTAVVDVDVDPVVVEVPDTSKDAEIAAALAATEEEIYYNNNAIRNNGAATAVGTSSATTTTPASAATTSVATVSAPWQYDDDFIQCHGCRTDFHPILNRKHHCRLCGYIFCHACSHYRALLPPTQIVLHPLTGKQTKPPSQQQQQDGLEATVSFSPDPDPDRMLTYITPGNSNTNTSDDNGTVQQQQLLHGHGLEERFQLAREPLRVCQRCYTLVQSQQDELRYYNSNAMRYNTIDPTHVQRLFNSPIANTLGHEIRKAAYALNNLLPQPKQRRIGAFVDIENRYNDNPFNPIHTDLQHCRDTCTSISPNLQDLDGVQIPARLLELAKGVAILTVIKGGFGFVGGEFGTGLVVARLPNPAPIMDIATSSSSISPSTEYQMNSTTASSFRWSAPSAIGTAGISWGALLGAQISDHVFLLMTDEAVTLLFSNQASVQLGADIGIAIGPLGRTLEGDLGLNGKQTMAPIYTYSMSKGLYAGISLDGKVIVSRPDVNEKFYGISNLSAEEILAGVVPTPPAAQPLYEALHRCHVYATMAETNSATATAQRTLQIPQQQQQQQQYLPYTTTFTGTTNSVENEASYVQEYGEQQQQQQHQSQQQQQHLEEQMLYGGVNR